MIRPTPEERLIDRLVEEHNRGEHSEPIDGCPRYDEESCQRCGQKLTKYETTKTCRNCEHIEPITEETREVFEEHVKEESRTRLANDLAGIRWRDLSLEQLRAVAKIVRPKQKEAEDDTSK